MVKYVLTEIPRNKLNAGYKAKNDIRTVLKNSGFEPIDIKESFKFDKIPEFLRLIKRLKKLPNESEIVFQSPVYSFMNPKFMPSILKIIEKKKFKIILVIHDIEFKRFKRDEKNEELEKELFALSSALIIHNEKMMSFLSDACGISPKKQINLGIFDYLCSAEFRERGLKNEVCVAGNLDVNKSLYIYKLSEMGKTTLNVYGGNLDEERGKGLNYKGSFLPEELPKNLQGSFGLVWDGISTDTCEGVTGEYLKINNPHKTSLYLAAGIPVIIWKEAALCSFIEENKLGFGVSSLSEIDEKINALNENSYKEMAENVKSVSEKIRSGAYILSAVKRAEEII